jgi:CheY-like chemotaxis protein
MAIQTSTTTPRSPLATQAASILVVEDDADHLEAVREILEDEGYIVEGADDGSVGLDRLLRGPSPDALLVDLLMPVMDGWRFIAEVKERPALAEIPIIVISGSGERTLVSAPVSAGYLEKPINAARLLETLAACLARRKRRASGTRPIGG